MSPASPTLRVTVPAPRDESVAPPAPTPARTLPPGLQAAFAQLDAAGVLARAGFGSSMLTALEDIALEDADGTAQGYVFFLPSDAEGTGDSLPLVFGSLRTSSDLPDDLLAAAEAEHDSFERTQARARLRELSSARIGHAIVRVLRAHGVEAAWNGSVGSRIQVAL